MPSTNIIMLQIVADGLEELKEEVVFVGGAVAELYADYPASSEIRPTLDVDCVIELSSNLSMQSWKNDYGQKNLHMILQKVHLLAAGYIKP